MQRIQNIFAAVGIVVLLFVLENKKLIPADTTQLLALILLLVVLLGQILFRAGVYQPHNWRWAWIGIGMAVMPLFTALLYAWWKFLPLQQILLAEGVKTTSIILVSLIVGINIGKKIK